MAGKRIPPNEFYVYILYREDGCTPFYVGKGGGSRWSLHEKHAYKNKTYKDRIILSMQKNGFVVPKMKVAEGLTSKEAIAIEIDLINRIGRHPHGPLANHTKGGEGVVGLPEDLLKRRGKAISMGLVASRQIRSQKSIERGKDPIYIAKLRAAIIAAHINDPSIGKRKSASFKKAWEGDEVRREKLRAQNKLPETNAKRRAAMLKRWQEPDTKDKMMRRFSPEVIERAKKTLAKTLQNPELRKKLSESGKKGAASRWGK